MYWKIQSNAKAHGVAWAARKAKEQGVNIDDTLLALGFKRVGVK